MSLYNRLGNCKNPYQGNTKKVLCVCSAGLLRSPTAAVVLSQAPYNFNTRAAGIVPSFALVPVDAVLLTWADEVVCMTGEQKSELQEKLEKQGRSEVRVICLDIEDNFAYRDPELMRMIQVNYDLAHTKPAEVVETKDE